MQGSVEVLGHGEPTAVETEPTPARAADRHEPGHRRRAPADDNVLAGLGATEEVGEVRLRFVDTDGRHRRIVAAPPDT